MEPCTWRLVLYEFTKQLSFGSSIDHTIPQLRRAVYDLYHYRLVRDVFRARYSTPWLIEDLAVGAGAR